MHIGLCHGPAGAGKTLSARRHACRDTAEPLLTTWGPREASDLKIHAILDEAGRLSATTLEHMRDLFDRHGAGLILIGTPGIEKQPSRHPQPYSRAGFAHRCRPPRDKEPTFVPTRRWRQLGLGLGLDDADPADARAVAATVRITGGNFRLVHRLSVQIERTPRINGPSAVTNDVVEAARSTLVVGAT